MKKLIAMTAIAMLATIGTTAAADSVARNNVACSTGSVYGFTVQGYGLTHYVQEQDLSRCPGAVGVPAAVDIFEPAEVVAWLESNGVEITDLRLRGDIVRRYDVAVLDDEGAPVFDDNGDQVFETIRKSRAPVNGGW